MDIWALLSVALLKYVFFIPLLTFHEWAHAWVAWKCGDDTAHKLGRVSLNPIVHMDLLGTVILPMAGMITGVLGIGFVMIGWGKPVPVSLNNLKHPRMQDTLIAMAGPLMNLVLAFVLLLLVKVAYLTKQTALVSVLAEMAQMSLFLCFFNLLPIPPLDGSHLILNATRMSYDLYFRLIPIGFIAVLLLIQFKPVQNGLVKVVDVTYTAMAESLKLPGIGQVRRNRAKSAQAICPFKEKHLRSWVFPGG